MYFSVEITATGDDYFELYFGNTLLISDTVLWQAYDASLDFTSGSCHVAVKIINTGGPGYFLASTSHGHLSGSQVRCSLMEEEEGWWREDFNHWHWPEAVEFNPNDGSSIQPVIDGIEGDAIFVGPFDDNTVPEFFCRWRLCGDCSDLDNIYDRAGKP